MAQRNPRRGTPTRATAKSKKAVVTETGTVEDTPGIGVDAGLAIFTTVVLVAAIVVVDMMMGKIDHGIFFSLLG
jgi:hypothetical protein